MCASSPKEMIAGGLRARIVCVDPQVLPVEFADPEFDAGFLRDLPHGVDPCGEKGEFHTTVYAGPTFRKPIPSKPARLSNAMASSITRTRRGGRAREAPC